MTNFDLSKTVIEFLKQAQVQKVVVCAGARNAPLVLGLSGANFEVFHYFEERASGYFALGLIKTFSRPVAIITTSGTAVAELLPAAIEATYQGLPLILISADRPKNYRKSGAPQAIEQVGIFSTYAERVYDLDLETKDFIFDWSFQKPIHLNVCFDDPLVDEASNSNSNEEKSVLIKTIPKPRQESQPIKVENPLIILSELSRKNVPEVKKFLLKSTALIYTESLSQLSNDIELQSRFINSSEFLIKKAFKEKTFDSVIRVGGIPTLRFWRDLEQEFKDVPVFNFSGLAFSGLSRTSKLYEISRLNDVFLKNENQNVVRLKAHNQMLNELKSTLIVKYPQSEPAFIFYLSQIVATEPIYIGNSLPIRHWDSFATKSSIEICASRGANGIDGQISTYLGWSEKFKSSYCLVGDLTALYDLASLGLSTQLLSKGRKIVILNNFGGQIFQRVFKSEIFTNPHKIQFEHWAKMWNWGYKLVKSQSDFFKNFQAEANSIIELQPDAEQTKQFFNDWDDLCQKI